MGNATGYTSSRWNAHKCECQAKGDLYEVCKSLVCFPSRLIIEILSILQQDPDVKGVKQHPC